MVNHAHKKDQFELYFKSQRTKYVLVMRKCVYKSLFLTLFEVIYTKRYLYHTHNNAYINNALHNGVIALKSDI